MDYFRLFGTKNCVYDDLVKYVTLGGLPGDHVERFLREVDDQTRGEPIDFDCPPDKIKENVCGVGVCTCTWVCVGVEGVVLNFLR